MSAANSTLTPYREEYLIEDFAEDMVPVLEKELEIYTAYRDSRIDLRTFDAYLKTLQSHKIRLQKAKADGFVTMEPAEIAKARAAGSGGSC